MLIPLVARCAWSVQQGRGSVLVIARGWNYVEHWCLSMELRTVLDYYGGNTPSTGP